MIGVLVFTGTATDSAGNVSVAEPLSLTVVNPADGAPPSVRLDVAEGTELTGVADVFGSVTDDVPEDVRWSLSIRGNDTGVITPIVTDAFGSVDNEVLGQVDATLLAAGAYTLTLTATDSGGRTRTDSVQVDVTEDYKLGNFEVAFTDMEVPVGGITLSVTRAYNSLRSGTRGDFGHGWELQIAQTEVRLVGNNGQELGGRTPLQSGDTLVITLPNGQEEAFVFQPRGQQYAPFLPASPHYIDTVWTPAIGTTSELLIDTPTLSPIGNGYVVFPDFNRDYTRDELSAGPTFGLRLRNGTVLEIDERSGELASITDTTGNTVRFTANGFFSDDGRGIGIDRDWLGRVSSVTAPDGAKVTYDYDGRGDLVAVTDQIGATTRFEYSADRPHYLDAIIDPLGRPAARTTYDADGRIESMIDAEGNSVSYAYDTDTKIQFVTDQLGYTTEIELDDRGNAVREVSPEGVVTLRRFDAEDNVTAETMVIGQPDSPANGETDDLTMRSTFDADGNVLTRTDYRGNVTRTQYSDNGTPTVITDVLGNVTRNNVDSRTGVLRGTTDPLGNTTTFGYDDDFNLTGLTDPDGVRLVSNSYNEFGDVTAARPAVGPATFFAYNVDGDQIASWTFIDTDGDGPDTDRTQVINYTRLDDADRAVWTGRIELPEGEHLAAGAITETTTFDPATIITASSTTYDLLGQVTETTDELGLTTQYTYDARGQQVETRSQSFTESGEVVWNVSRTVYDSRGNVIASTRSYVEGETTEDVRGSQTIYDGDSRAVESRSVEDLDIEIVYDAASGLAISSVVTNVGDIITATETLHDSAGRVIETVNVDDLRSETTYGPFGDVIRTRSQTPDENGNLVWMVSHTVYDDFGRAVLTTDRTLEGFGDTVYGTVTSYDELGRSNASQRVEGVVVEVVDGNTVVIDEGEVLYETSTAYDDRGRTSHTIGADGQRVDYVYDQFGRQVATIGAEVFIGGQLVRHRTEQVYNELGQVQTERSNITQFADGTTDQSDVRETAYQYDVRGNAVRTTFADGTFVTATYDDLGRKSTETNQLGHTRSFEYDVRGQLVAVTLPSFTDAGGNLVTPRYQYGYDAEGNQTTLTDPLGRQTQWEFDEQGRQVSRTMPLGVGQASSLSSPTATPVTERFEYDARGRQTLHVSFEGVVTTMVYDDYSRMSERRFWSDQAAYIANPDAPDEVWSYRYDAYGREIEVTQTDNRTGTAVVRSATKQYDDQGRWTGHLTPEGRINYAYDDLGRKTLTSVGDPDNPDRSTTYGYDELGRLSSVTERDFIGQTNTATPQSSAQTELTSKYFYDLLGNLDGELNANGVFTDNQYDILNRLDGMTSYRTDGTEADIADLSDNEVVADFDYEVRQDGRRTRLDERIEVDGVLQESTRTYAYDDLGRLIRETLDSDFDDDLDHVIDYAFDATGNRVQKAVDNDPVDTNGDGEITTADTPAFDVFTDYTFNAGDQLIEEIVTDAAQTVTGRTTHTYDGTQNSGKTEYEADGSVKSRTEMTYDLQGRLEVTDISSFAGGTLTSRSRSTYDYDATGIRIAALRQIDADGDGTFEQTTDVRFLVDHANHTGYQQVLRESHFDADGNLVKQVDYTFGHDELHQTVKDIDAATGDVTSSRTDFFLHDGHGDVRALLGLAGAVATIAGIEQAFYYDAYGQLVNMTTDQAGTTLLYSGEQTDALTGSQYLRARYYNPNSGQFNRVDDFFGNHQDPQSLHKYAYVHGDPISNQDPTGRSALSVGVTVAAVGIATTVVAVSALSTYMLFSDRFSTEEANSFYFKYLTIGVTASLLAGIGTGAVLASSTYAAVAGLSGGGSIAMMMEHGEYFYNIANLGLMQAYFVNAKKLIAEKEFEIKHAANDFGVPSKVLATVLVAEMLNYSFEDFIGDDDPIFSPEKRSIGWVQLRTDNMRSKGIAGWNAGTSGGQIRDSIRNTDSGIRVLAEYLKWLLDHPTPGASHLVTQTANFDSLSVQQQKLLAKEFASAKDRSGVGNPYGLGVPSGGNSLGNSAFDAWDIVSTERRFD